MQGTIERAPGFYDLDSAEYTRRTLVMATLQETFRSAGFGLVDVPIVEQLELYRRKNGGQVLSRILGFTDQNKRELALRPEFTASIIRALGPQVRGVQAPLRVAYGGPVFYRDPAHDDAPCQHTQAGVETLGAGDPETDAEIMSLACRAALDLEVQGLHLVIGHLGPLRTLLSHLGVDGYEEQYLLEHLETYSRGGTTPDEARRRLGLLGADTANGERNGEAVEEALSTSLVTAIRDASVDESRQVVASILAGMGIDLSGSTRPPDEIIDRVLVKARRSVALRAGSVWRVNLERALAFVERLGAIRGQPGPVLSATEALLRAYNVPDTALHELRHLLPLLAASGLGGVTIELAPAMARGIAYYSGLIFELQSIVPFHDATGATNHRHTICGGGRYDGLAAAITTEHSFPALGFAFDLESILQVIPETPKTAGNPRSRQGYEHA